MVGSSVIYIWRVVSRERYWQGPRFPERGGRGGEETIQCPCHNDFVSTRAPVWAVPYCFIRRTQLDDVHKPSLFEERGEPKRDRTQVLPFTSLAPRRWAKSAYTSRSFHGGGSLSGLLWCPLMIGICHCPLYYSTCIHISHYFNSWFSSKIDVEHHNSQICYYFANWLFFVKIR